MRTSPESKKVKVLFDDAIKQLEENFDKGATAIMTEAICLTLAPNPDCKKEQAEACIKARNKHIARNKALMNRLRKQIIELIQNL